MKARIVRKRWALRCHVGITLLESAPPIGSTLSSFTTVCAGCGMNMDELGIWKHEGLRAVWSRRGVCPGRIASESQVRILLYFEAKQKQYHAKISQVQNGLQ